VAIKCLRGFVLSGIDVLRLGWWYNVLYVCDFGAGFYCPPSICWMECYICKWKSTPGLPLV